MKFPITNQEMSRFLKQQPLIQGLNDKELSYLVDVVETIYVGPGETIFLEGEHSNELYFIFDGAVNVLKYEQKSGVQYSLGMIQTGAFFGDLAFLDDEPRSSSIKTVEPTTVLKISKEYAAVQSAEMENIYNKIMTNISRITLKRLRDTNEVFAQSMNEKVHQLRQINDSGKLFTIAVIAMWAMGIVTTPIESGFVRNWVHAILALTIIVPLIYHFHLPFSHFGLSLKNSKSSMIPIGVIVSGLVGLTAINALLVQALLYIYPQMTWFNLVPLKGEMALLFYPLYACVREFLIRGIIQQNLRDFLQDERGEKSVFLTSLLMAILGFPLGWPWVLAQFSSSYLLGSIYNHYRQLLGVALIHTVLGFLLVIWKFMDQSSLFNF